MTRQNKLIALIVYLLILSVCMLAYRTNRAGKVKLLRADLARVTADQEKTKEAVIEVKRLSRLIPTETGTPAFIEFLYKSARESGLKQHEVSTESDKSSGSARPGGADTGAIVKQRLKVSASGSYRNFAEYIRLVQNAERFNRITEFKLTPDANQLKGTVTIELSTLPVNK